MRFLICLIRSHRPVRVKLVDVVMTPGVGLQTVYERDDDGDHHACERCGRVLRS